MATFNPDFWEIATDSVSLERVPSDKALWFETSEDRAKRHARNEFFSEVKPVVDEMIEASLTKRQSEVIRLYFYYGKTQEDIAIVLNLSQSTVSRHLFGTVRAGKKVGGAIPKLRKVLERNAPTIVSDALELLQQRMREAV